MFLKIHINATIKASSAIGYQGFVKNGLQPIKQIQDNSMIIAKRI